MCWSWVGRLTAPCVGPQKYECSVSAPDSEYQLLRLEALDRVVALGLEERRPVSEITTDLYRCVGRGVMPFVFFLVCVCINRSTYRLISLLPHSCL